jgi:hypothetical protein
VEHPRLWQRFYSSSVRGQYLTMKQSFNSSRFRRLAALIAADLLFFGMTDPANVPSFALIIGFLLFAITLYQFVKGLIRFGSWYGLTFTQRQQRLARITTGVVAGLVALQSMGQLGGRDVLVLVPLALVTYLYISYGQAATEAVTLKE